MTERRRSYYSPAFPHSGHRRRWMSYVACSLIMACLSVCADRSGSVRSGQTARPVDHVQSSQRTTTVGASSAIASIAAASATPALSGSLPAPVPSLSPTGDPPTVVVTDVDVQQPITVPIGTVIDVRLTVDPAGGTIDPARSDNDAVVHRTAMSSGLGATSAAGFVAVAIGHARLVAGEHFPCAAGVACAAAYGLGFDVTVTPRTG
jgi:hypothetical protein